RHPRTVGAPPSAPPPATAGSIQAGTRLDSHVTSRPISILDLAAVGHGESIGDSVAGCVALARLAERTGYTRIWYAEHHNIRSIASSATAVLIAHIAAHTERIPLGSGASVTPHY